LAKVTPLFRYNSKNETESANLLPGSGLMMTNLVKRLITNLRYPLQVLSEADVAVGYGPAAPQSRDQQEEELLEDCQEYEYLIGDDLYSLDDDNCSFHLWEEDEDDFMEWDQEDVFW
jgi:hypothetical protein